MTSGNTMLTLTGTANLSGTAIRAAMQGGSKLDTGDTINLIQSAGTITTDSSTTYGKMTQAEYNAIKDKLPSGMLSDGVSLDYEMDIKKSDDGKSIVLTVGNVVTDDDNNNSGNNNSGNNNSGNNNSGNNNSGNNNSSNNNSSSNSSIINNVSNNSGGSSDSPNRTKPQTKSLATAPIASVKLADFMSDKLVDWLPPRSFDFEDDEAEEIPDAPQKESNGYEVFISAGGGSFRNKTGDGSYIESTQKGFDIGLGRSIDYSDGRLVFAPIFEYANGDYDTYLADGTHGKGSTKYVAGGLIGRKTFNDGFYVEASARGGETTRDFTSYDMKSGETPVLVHYDKTSAPIITGHLRFGKQLRLDKNNLLDVYGIYFHTRQCGMGLKLSTGEDYHFSPATSARSRLGYRLTTRTSKISRIYTGLAYQYEHTSNVTGTYKGYKTPSAGNHGSSGMLELGWMIKPNKNNPWMLDFNATGWVGHQQGLSGTFKLQKSF